MRLALAFLAAAALAPPAWGCGADTDCRLGERTYRIALPSGPAPYGAIVFMHGYRGSAAGLMENEALRREANRVGAALIAPKSGGEDWLIRNGPRRGLTDDTLELAYFDALLDDVTARFPVDPDRILATGFSAGGMMTWTLACHRADRFTAFAPVSGTFWAPHPEDCPGGAVDILHIHGTADEIVPLTGRRVADSQQGDVYATLATWMDRHGYREPVEVPSPPAGFDCGADAAGDKVLALCLHARAHVVEAEWIGWAYETLVDPGR